MARVAVPVAEAASAREEAQRILDSDRYRARDVPRPLRGVLRWLGDRIADLAEPVQDLLSTPGGIAITVLTVLAVAALLATRAVRHRNRTQVQSQAARRRARRLDPAVLEREADEAEAGGDLGEAVRLRFRAGVARLEEAGAIPARADTTTRRLVAAVPSSTLADLARTFEAVAYGGRPARPADAEAARRDWPAVVAGARSANSVGTSS